MGLEQLQLHYITGSEYSFGPEISLSDSFAFLNLIPRPGQTFALDFFSTEGWTFNTSPDDFLFSGGVLSQLPVIPANSTFYASFSSMLNADWGSGSLIDTPVGSPIIDSIGLNLTGGGKYASFPYAGNADSLQQGCIRFQFTPNYSDNPVSNEALFYIGNSISNANIIALDHETDGRIVLKITDSTSAAIIFVGLGYWNPVAGALYEFELDYDITNGVTNLFINGIQFGSTQTETGTRSDSFTTFFIGGYPGGQYTNGWFANFVIFNVPKHTANYTTPTLPLYNYIFETATAPIFVPISPGQVLTIQSLTITDNGGTRYIIGTSEAGKFYWNTIDQKWELSDYSWAKSSPASDIEANITSLVDNYLGGQINNLEVCVKFGNGYSPMSISEFSLVYTDQIYPTDNPTISGNVALSIFTNQIVSFSEGSIIVPDSGDLVTYVLIKNDVPYWFNGSAWDQSNGTFSQSNTAVQINTNLSTFIVGDNPASIFFLAFLHSGTGSSTPELDFTTIIFNFIGVADTVHICNVWGYLYDESMNPLVSANVVVQLAIPQAQYKSVTLVISKPLVFTTDQNGYWEAPLIETASMLPADTQYQFIINGKKYLRSIPDLPDASFFSLVSAPMSHIHRRDDLMIPSNRKTSQQY